MGDSREAISGQPVPHGAGPGDRRQTVPVGSGDDCRAAPQRPVGHAPLARGGGLRKGSCDLGRPASATPWGVGGLDRIRRPLRPRSDQATIAVPRRSGRVTIAVPRRSGRSGRATIAVPRRSGRSGRGDDCQTVPQRPGDQGRVCLYEARLRGLTAHDGRPPGPSVTFGKWSMIAASGKAEAGLEMRARGRRGDPGRAGGRRTCPHRSPLNTAGPRLRCGSRIPPEGWRRHSRMTGATHLASTSPTREEKREIRPSQSSRLGKHPRP